jgi:hypothetical protein
MQLWLAMAPIRGRYVGIRVGRLLPTRRSKSITLVDKLRQNPSEASTVQSSVRSRRNVPPRKSSYDTAAEKSELLYKIDRLKKRGFASHRTVTFDDDLDSIRLEFERMNRA